MREIEEIGEVDCLSRFFEEIVPQMSFRRIPMYRGQKKRWSILPSLFRETVASTQFSSWSELEGAAMMAFKESLASALDYRPETELEWMAAAHQCQLPNRLSAWTENALVALYCASDPTDDQQDGVVWRILPGEESFTIAQDYEQVPSSLRVYRPRYMDEVTRNHRTCYLTHPLPQEDAAAESFEDLYELGEDPMHVGRMIVPASCKKDLRRQLAMVGMDAATLRPGREALGERVRNEVFFHTDHYDWCIPERGVSS